MKEEKIRLRGSPEYRKWVQERIRKRTPWAFVYWGVRQRCSNPKHSYYKRGIKNYLTKEEIKYLWFRDKAYLLKRPSIDRINNKGNYILENCRFIELSENSTKDTLGVVFSTERRNNIRKAILQRKAGRWAFQYDRCDYCKRTLIPHHSWGLCDSCYSKLRQRKTGGLNDYLQRKKGR